MEQHCGLVGVVKSQQLQLQQNFSVDSRQSLPAKKLRAHRQPSSHNLWAFLVSPFQMATSRQSMLMTRPSSYFYIVLSQRTTLERLDKLPQVSVTNVELVYCSNETVQWTIAVTGKRNIVQISHYDTWRRSSASVLLIREEWSDITIQYQERKTKCRSIVSGNRCRTRRLNSDKSTTMSNLVLFFFFFTSSCFPAEYSLTVEGTGDRSVVGLT